METHRAEKKSSPIHRRVIAGVIAAGAVAGAVVAIGQAWSLFSGGPEITESVRISNVEKRRDATMSEYAAEQAGSRTSGAAGHEVLIRPVVIAPPARTASARPTQDVPVRPPQTVGPTTVPTTDSPPTDVPETDEPSTGVPTTDSPTGTEPATPTPTPAVTERVDAIRDLSTVVQDPALQRYVELPPSIVCPWADRMSTADPTAGPMTCLGPPVLQGHATLGQSESPDSPPLDDEAVKELFLRTLETIDATTTGDRTDPMGMIVSADYDIQGYENEPLKVTWSLSGPGVTPEWTSDRVVQYVTVTREIDHGSVEVWVPDLAAPGEYTVSLAVYRVADGGLLDLDSSLHIANP